MKPRLEVERRGRSTPFRVLVVEDEFLVSLLLEEELRSLGCTIVGPFKRLAEASAASHREDFDLAILDINLDGEMVYPLADELAVRRVPFVFVSGYDSPSLPDRFRGHPCIAKPYDGIELASQVKRLLVALGRN
jgi:DNA-binding response OmpR family regulator